MSTIWTPSGERPVGRPTGEQEQAGRGAQGPGTAGPSDEEVAARLRELTEELLRTPAAVVVANHAMGLYELAALHLAQRPPNLTEARLAIDALGALVEGLGNRLGESEAALREFLARIRLAFVQATSQATAAGGSGGSGASGSGEGGTTGEGATTGEGGTTGEGATTGEGGTTGEGATTGEGGTTGG